MRKHVVLGGGVVSTLALTAFFMYLQNKESPMLELPAHWIALATMPIIISLIVGGFITSFKGFGIELVSNLNRSVNEISLTAADTADELPEYDKQRVDVLHRESFEKRSEIYMLNFTLNRQHYYEAEAIEAYLWLLPNLRYFLVRKERGEFVCIVPIEQFKESLDPQESNYNRQLIREFVVAIEQGTVTENFPHANSVAVLPTDNLAKVAKLLVGKRLDMVAVVNSSGKYEGVVFAEEVFKKVSEFVIDAKEKSV